MLPLISYNKDNPTGPVTRIDATNDNNMFYLNIEFNQNISPGDTLMIAFDYLFSRYRRITASKLEGAQQQVGIPAVDGGRRRFGYSIV